MLAEIVFAVMALTPTDQTVNVTKGTKLDVNNFAGDVVIKVWNKDAVRVEVNHSDREIVEVKQGEQVVTVRSRSVRGGQMRSLDYTISVPSWMAVSVTGNYADVTMEDVSGDVAVETNRGDIKVRGGSGFVSLKTVQGEINLEKAKGRIEVRAINESIHLADISGDLSAESTNGSILLDRIDSTNVDLYTVNGNISYDGPVKDKGLYRLTTHNGLIAMAIPEKANITLTARTYNGGFRSSFPLPGDTAGAEKRNKRVAMTIGNGSAHVELESFGGTIALRRPGEARPETERKRREKDKDSAGVGVGFGRGVGIGLGRVMADIQPEIDAAIAAAQPEIDAAMAAVQPEIEAAMAEAMHAIRDMPMPHIEMPAPHVMPIPRPAPLPRPR